MVGTRSLEAPSAGLCSSFDIGVNGGSRRAPLRSKKKTATAARARARVAKGKAPLHVSLAPSFVLLALARLPLALTNSKASEEALFTSRYETFLKRNLSLSEPFTDREANNSGVLRSGGGRRRGIAGMA